MRTSLFKGFEIRTDGELVEIHLDNTLVCSYHPRYGETYVGYQSPKTWVNAKEALEYGRRQNECNWEISS